MRKLLLFLLLMASVAAASYTDTTNADFSLGNVTQVNATNNSVILHNMTLDAYNTSGVFTSAVFDLGSNPYNISINWSYTTPSGTSLLIATRSGNNATNFSSWSSFSSSYSTSTGSTVTSPRNRYYQYQATLTTTNNTTTPALYDATIIYSNNGTELNFSSSTPNITSSSTGNQNLLFTINDTYIITSVVGAYRVDTYTVNGTYSAAVNLSTSGANYNLTVPQPSGNWYSYRYGNVTIQLNVTVNNGSADTTTSFTLAEPIDFINTAPTVDPISGYTQVQATTLNFTVTGGDTDNHTLTFSTNASYVTVTSLTNTSARLTWTPNATQIGTHNIIVYANDTFTTSSATFQVNVTDVNDAPTITSVSAITGYHGIRMLITLTGYDPDNGANISFSMVPSYFSFTTNTTSGNSSAVAGVYYGITNSTPADDEHGVQNITFSVSDGIASANTTTTMTISWCGDLTCDSSYETAATCAVDCVTVEETSQIALIVPDRNCANTSMDIYTFNASDRFSCYYQGLVEQGFALCEGLDGVNVKVYVRNGTRLTELTSLTSATNGSISYTPTLAGDYKFSAEKEDFSNVSSFVTVRDCSNDIVVQTQNYTIAQPATPRVNRTIGAPQEELPSLTDQEASWFAVLIFYIIVPLLLAALLYTSVVFYDVNKDTLPWLLEGRILLYEQRVKFDPQIKQVQRALAPVYEPVAESLGAIYSKTLKPIVEKLRKR